MGKKFFIVVLILILLTIIAGHTIYQYRSQKIEDQKINKQYESYQNIEILGTELISLINKTMDLNERNEIPKDDSGNYVDNKEKSIRIYVKFMNNDKFVTIPMESIANKGSEAFINVYSTENFKCTEIEHYEKTKNVKSLTFEEI